MNWRRKAQIQKLLSSLPLSDALYFAMQRTMGSLRKGNVNPLEWFSAAIRIADWTKGENRELVGDRFLEVGTGRMVSLPMDYGCVELDKLSRWI
jgi:hypothetical protein